MENPLNSSDETRLIEKLSMSEEEYDMLQYLRSMVKKIIKLENQSKDINNEDSDSNLTK